ncbi:MAG: type I restriction enzyme HsdR N-terminal domain-containing protein [Bacteroidales bacterium]|nr:type I restriction enzyme HsdR N-terminal domain-containing protein [Bacteroidales bacterium]
MKELNLPEYSFTIVERESKKYILDTLRKKFVRLTPEEWVRQNFIRYLVSEGHYPAGLIAVEVSFTFNRMRRKADILIYNRSGEPVMIVECKSPETDLSEDRISDQVVDYNRVFRVPYLVITNGLTHYAVKITDFEKNEFEFLMYIPLYQDLIENK